MTEPARPWPEQGQGLNSLISRAKRRTGPLEAVPTPEPPLEPLPRPWQWHHQGAATWHAHPEMHYLAVPDATRPPNAVEAARYARRRTNPYDELAWLYRLDAELNGTPALGATDNALAPGVGSSDEGVIGYG